MPACLFTNTHTHVHNIQCLWLMHHNLYLLYRYFESKWFLWNVSFVAAKEFSIGSASRKYFCSWLKFYRCYQNEYAFIYKCIDKTVVKVHQQNVQHSLFDGVFVNAKKNYFLLCSVTEFSSVCASVFPTLSSVIPNMNQTPFRIKQVLIVSPQSKEAEGKKLRGNHIIASEEKKHLETRVRLLFFRVLIVTLYIQYLIYWVRFYFSLR